MQTAFLLIFAGSLFAGIVADPDRAKSIQWKTYHKKGHDFWLLLDYHWHDLPGVNKERFVQETGLHAYIGTSTNKDARLIEISDLGLKGTNGAKVKAALSVSGPDPKLHVEGVKNMTDGKLETFCRITSKNEERQHRYKSVKVFLKVSAEKPVREIVITTNGTRLRNYSIRNRKFDRSGKEGKYILTLKKPVANFEIELDSMQTIKSLRAFRKVVAPVQKIYPFYLENYTRLSNRKTLGLTKENIIPEQWKKIIKDHPDTYLGARFAEWDSNLGFRLSSKKGRKELKDYFKLPCDREGMVRHFQKMWNIMLDLHGGKAYGLSGMCNLIHLGMDFGSQVAAQEITSEHKDHQHRNFHLFLRGASRQFDKPMLMYLAYYLHNYCSNSRRNRSDFGIPPSQGLRNFFITYYMGVNYLDFETQPYSAVRPAKKKGHWELSGNGKAIKEIFEWSRSPKGKRGSSYAPILLLADRTHGYDNWRRYSTNYGPFYNMFPRQDRDWMIDYVMQAISPNTGYVDYGKKGFVDNLRNSTLGDIFDLYITNPYSGEIRLDQLEKYPVVFIVDDIAYTEKMANTFKQYVANGGTLILTSGQMSPYANDPEFIGAVPMDYGFWEDELVIRNFKLTSKAEVLMKTSKAKQPLIFKNKYGNGHVIMIASPFFRKINKSLPPKQLITFLENIQAELLPVKIEGDCQFLFNILPDGTWKVILVNNNGIRKLPTESEERFDMSCVSRVSIVAPAGTKAKEIRCNQKITQSFRDGKNVFTMDIPPAGIMVVDVTGIPATQPKKFPSFRAKGVKDFKPNKSGNPMLLMDGCTASN